MTRLVRTRLGCPVVALCHSFPSPPLYCPQATRPFLAWYTHLPTPISHHTPLAHSTPATPASQCPCTLQAHTHLRAFARAVPFAWKALPADVCMLQSLTSSTSLIKCHTLRKVTFSPDLSLPSSAGRPTEGLAEGSVKDSQHRGISQEEKRQACAAHLLCARL